MMAAIDPNVWSFSRTAFAVSLGSGWTEVMGGMAFDYTPWVSNMWVKVEGDSNFRVRVGGIADNAGTGANCTISWEVLLEVLETILPFILEYLAEQPPQKEWQSDLHWAQAIVRANPPRITNPSPILRTAGADFDSLFLQEGYQSLTITAGAEIWLQKCYWTEFPHYTDIYIGTHSINCQVKVPVTNAPNAPYIPSGRNSGYTYTTYDYSTSTTDPNGDNVRYQFDWGDGTSTITGLHLSGETVSASHYWTSSDRYIVRVRAQDTFNEWSDWSPSLTVAIGAPDPPVRGGYPYVSTWNGTDYVLDNNVLPKSEASQGADVEDYYRLEQNLVPKNGKYSLVISEFEQEHSYFDQVNLLAVDHESDVHVAVTQNGEILTYKNPAAPIAAFDNNGTDRLSQINRIDGNIAEPSTYFYGQRGDYLVLNFGVVDTGNAKLILRDDMKCQYETICCIEVQVLDNNGEWVTVEVLAPRAYWTTQAVNLSPYIVREQELAVRLFWTLPHRLDFVGLDTTKQEDYLLCEANLISAAHSTLGDVKTQLLQSDNINAELEPSQQIQLEFTLPNKAKQARTYILYAKGRYFTIP